MAALMGLPEVQAELFYLEMENGGPALELIRLTHPVRREIPPPLDSRGSITLSLQVKEIESLHQRLKEEGRDPNTPCQQLYTPQGQAMNSSPSTPKKGWPWNSSRKWKRTMPFTRDPVRPNAGTLQVQS